MLIGAAGIMLLVVWMGMKKRKQRQSHIAAHAWEQWKHLGTISDGSRRILEAENILSHALRETGKRGTFGDILKSMQKTLPNIDAVWQAHKVRNRIAHEPGIVISNQEVKRALHTFEKALQILFPL